MDANDPDASKFASGSVPVVHSTSLDPASASNKDGSRGRGNNISRHDRDRCSCIPPNTSPLDHLSSYWSYPLPWDPSWSASEVRKEEYRRLCWSALNLVTSFTSQCALFNREPPDLFLSDPANVCHHFFFVSPQSITHNSSSLRSCFREKPWIGLHRHHRHRRTAHHNHNQNHIRCPQKSQFGPCIAVACSCGIFVPDCGRILAPSRRRQSMLSRRGWRRRPYRILWTCMCAIFIRL